MNLSKFYHFIASTLLALFIAGLGEVSLEATTANRKQQDQQQNGGLTDIFAKESGPSYSAPFLVLMSSNEISVVQLPLIENGNVSVVYKLEAAATSEQAIEKEAEEVEGGDGALLAAHYKTATSTTSAAVESAADAPPEIGGAQMPPSTSLGKSLSQQIAGSRFISGHEREEVGAEKEEDAVKKVQGGHNGNKATQYEPRRKRSNSLSEASGGPDVHNNDDGSANGGRGGSSSSNSNIAASESSLVKNVTSAQFKGLTMEGTTAPAEDDKSSVQFSDFDVHMSLGYAFVADSKGRIHRFKLSGLGGGETLGNENLLENDYTRTIEAARATSTNFNANDLSLAKGKIRRANATSGQQRVLDDSGYDVDDDDDEANKVDGGAVTHEQSGQHPATSGAAGADSTRKQAEYAADLANGGGLQAANGGATPISDPLLTGRFTTNHLKQRSTSARPSIIWSRVKFGDTIGADLSTNQPQLPRPQSPSSSSSATSVDSQALPKKPSNVSAIKQMANEASNSVGRVDGSDGAQSSWPPNDDESQPNSTNFNESEIGEQTSGLANQNESGGPEPSATHMRTQIAVDWLNNLLFVLDNFHLFVVDFDGNNELVLIDDFNINNRPVDIKVDPVNDFLFWLQVGNFHNTIYKLDLSVLSMPTATERLISNLKLSGQNNSRPPSGVFSNGSGSSSSSNSELVALISHHYAHPIITNLPKSAKLFTIDHKHSRIYVPLTPAPTGNTNSSSDRNQTQLEEAEVFSGSADESNIITHMNSTANQAINEPFNIAEESDKIYCNTSDSSGLVLAYNLDGTDVGPLRSDDQRGHLFGINEIQDFTLDFDKGFLYWLTSDGKYLSEEYKNPEDPSFYSAQHGLDGKKYLKLVHFGSNQPKNRRARFNLRKLIQILSTSTSTNRWIRSDGRDQFEENGSPSSLNGRHRASLESDVSKLPRTPYLILGVTGLIVLSVYLVYSIIFQQYERRSSNLSRGDSIGGSSVGDASRVDGNVITDGFGHGNTLSRWIVRPSTRSADTSTFNHDSSENADRFESCEVESTNYDTSNAVDEHYRDMINNQQLLLDLDASTLVNLRAWPAYMNDEPNKFYVPQEVLQDEALSSIHRVAIDQLEIERRDPLGKGHFGTVLQGTITCPPDEKFSLLNRTQTVVTINEPQPTSRTYRNTLPSSTSSGHGSSSTSSDFATANSCVEATVGDYMTPKSHCNSAMSDYALENSAIFSKPDNSYLYSSNGRQSNQVRVSRNRDSNGPNEALTKFKVAIKKLKDNASAEEKRDFLQEAKLLANFDHPNIVRLIGICLDRGSTLIIMELMLGGDLERYMQKNVPRPDNPENLTDDDLLTICLDIVNGCCYLEDLNCIHRDLAARNCLVSSRRKEERVVKLADFGLARDIYKDSYYKKVNDSALPLKWMAPECLIEQKFTIMSDVWSYGVVMWEVMSYCREKPYEDVAGFLMTEYLTGGARLRKPESCCEEVYKLMNNCWKLNPKDRPSFQECRSMLLEIKNRRL